VRHETDNIRNTDKEKKEVKDLVSLGTIRYDKVYSDEVSLFDLSQHRYIEICYVTEGAGLHRIWNKIYSCKKGSLSILNIAVPHGWFAKDKDQSVTVSNIIFDINDILIGELAEIGNRRFLFNLFSSNNFAVNIKLDLKQQKIIEDFYNDIQDEQVKKKSEWKTIVISKMMMLLIYAKRLAENNETVSYMEMSEEEQIVSRVIQYINNNYNDPAFSMQKTADELYISKASLSRKFYNIMGEHFSDYVRNSRFKRAIYLMQNTQMSNENIAEQCGYKDIPTFYRQFKKIYGVTPQRYREQLLTANNRKKVQNDILLTISENLQRGKTNEIISSIEAALDVGLQPETIINEGLIAGMNIIGARFRENKVFVPEVLVAARAMNKGIQQLKTSVFTELSTPIGTAVICTVKGDMHDIGKNLVKIMLEAQNIRCIDLGVDVDPQEVVSAVKKHDAQLVCASALLTTTRIGQKEIIDALTEAGLREQVYIMVGGAPVTQEFADEIGADCYTKDAASAAQAAKEFLLKTKREGMNIMTNKERFRNCAIGKDIDRTPFMFYFGPWGETIERWKQEDGIEDPGAWCAAEFGFDQGIQIISGPVYMFYYPAFEYKVLEETDRHIIYQDMHGSILQGMKGKSAIPKILKPAVTCREDWEKIRDERLNPDIEERFTPFFYDYVKAVKEMDAPVQIGAYPYGLFGTLRDMIGVEELCYMFYDEPELIHEMMDYITDFWLKLYEKIVQYIDVDIIHIWEDMSGKSGSIISPDMVREFMLPNYKKICDFAKKHNIAVIAVDTDGICDDLIPLFAEAGINMMMPFEVAAGNDVVELRKRFPNMSLMGGIDKMEIAKGKEAIDRELDRIEPLLGKPGYYPALDHLINPEISYKDYVYFVEELRKRIYNNRKTC